MPDVGELVGRLLSDDLDRRERGRTLVALARGLGATARRAGAAGRQLTDVLVDDVVPHLPVRDLLTLRQHHGGLSGDDLAAALVTQAARVTAGIGGAAGAVASLELAAPPLLLTAPAQLVAETLAVVAVEVKLVAELHVVYGRKVQGTRAQVALSYLAAWANRTAADGSGAPGLDLGSTLTATVRHRVRQRVVRRLQRNLATLAPFFVGAVTAAELNRRETKAVGAAVTSHLRPRR
jgi:hypothetical protein